MDSFSACMSEGLHKQFPDNNLQLMVRSGAKGSAVCNNNNNNNNNNNSVINKIYFYIAMMIVTLNL